MKNKILWSITYFMFVVFLLSGASFDSDNIVVPAIGFVVSLLWMFAFAKVNKERFEV